MGLDQERPRGFQPPVGKRFAARPETTRDRRIPTMLSVGGAISTPKYTRPLDCRSTAISSFSLKTQARPSFGHPHPVRSPVANAFTKRWIGSIRRELLDRTIIRNQHQLERLVIHYVHHYNETHPTGPSISGHHSGPRHRPRSIDTTFAS